MRNKIKFLLGVVILLFATTQINAQATSAINANVPLNPNVEYIGWDDTVNEVLNIKNEDSTEIHFFTNAGANALNNRKMIIGYRTLNGIEHAGVGIESTGGTHITRLRSLLHLGNDGVFGIAGWREWLDVGTFCSKGSDYAYFGTMTDDGDSTVIGGDDNDAVIVWGDNLQDATDGADNLRIIFNAPMTGTFTANRYHGLEVSRYSPIGRVGIGNFSAAASGEGSGIEPIRRLEIYGENNDSLLRTDAPQLRLTYTPDAVDTNGIHTDFETTSLGDLIITPSSDQFNPSERRVGINTSSPNETLEINSNTANNSGLIFTDLRPGSPNGILPYGHVLTVDSTGKVVLTDDIGGNGSVTACSATLTTDVGFLTKWTILTTGGGREICRSQGIYEDNTWPYHVGIGVGNAPNTNMKVHMKGDLFIESEPGHSWGGDIQMNDALSHIKPVLAMYGLSGYGALSVGHDAGNSEVYSDGGSAFGGSTFVGFESAHVIDENTAANSIFGYWAGYNLNDGSENNIFGYRAGLNLTNGIQNIIIGTDAAPGFGSGLFEDGDANIFIGYHVQNDRLPIGQENIVIGKEAYIRTENTSTTSADNNIVIGSGARALDNVTRSGQDEIQRSVVIGDRAEVWCDSCIVLGRINVHRVGIGTREPSSTAVLDVDPPTGLPWAAIFRDTAIQVNSVHVASDQNLKEMITPLSNISNLLANLNTYSFKYKKEQFPNVGIDGGFHYGFLAQELELLFPMLVSNQTADAMHDSTGNEIAPATPYKTINYLEIIPLLVQGFQEQKQIIDSLKIVISQCCAASITPEPGNRSSINLSNHASIILNQNVPNPFRDKTEITYNIPETVTEAAILFYDQSGKILNTFEISTRGQGSLTVYGDDLTGGIYTYTLIVDGEPVQTKKMMKE